MKTAIVGNGNVASHLKKAFEGKMDIVQVNPHTLEGFPDDADLILLCVTDDAIFEVAEKLPETKAIIAHTSGSVPLSLLAEKGSAQGVFYPLQTFTKGVDLNYQEIPVFIEGSTPKAEKFLEGVAALFSGNIRRADSEERRKLHLASVFACNFVNALAGIGTNLLSGTTIPGEVLLPLMRQTIKKLETLKPKAAQTGPAARNDIKTMEKHLEMLAGNEDLIQLYSVFSKLIATPNYGNGV